MAEYLDAKDGKYDQQQVKCGASWQVILSNKVNAYIVQCRHCKVRLTAGGTPKCLKDEK